MKNLPLEFDIVLVKTREYSNLVLHKGRDLHQTKYYGSAWLDMGDEYAELYVLFNGSYLKNLSDTSLVELIDKHDKYDGNPCEDGAACFAHKTKPCDKCGRLEGRIVLASSSSRITPKAWLPESYLGTYVQAYNSQKPLERIILGQDFSHMELIGGRYDEEIYKLSTDSDGSVYVIEKKETKTCAKHKKNIEKYNGSLENLVEDIGDLHYESLAELISLLSEKFLKDAKKDNERGRPILANSLFDTSMSLKETAAHVKRAWEISRPFMEAAEEAEKPF